MFNRNKTNDGWWNYRFLMRPTYKNNKVISYYYEMIEVYYDKNGNILAWTDEPEKIIVESYKDLKTYIKQIKDASKRSLLKIVEGSIEDSGLFMTVNDRISAVIREVDLDE